MVEIPAKDVRHCLDKARELAEHYSDSDLHGRFFPRQVERLIELVGEYFSTSFTIRKLHASQKRVSAMYWRYEDGAYTIFVLDGLPEVDRRFALCKELFHVVLDEPSCWRIEIFGHLEEVSATFPVLDSKPSPAVAWEILAEAAAMEFLFPYEERAAVIASCGSDIDYVAVAGRYNLPARYVEWYLSAPYMEYFGAFRA